MQAVFRTTHRGTGPDGLSCSGENPAPLGLKATLGLHDTPVQHVAADLVAFVRVDGGVLAVVWLAVERRQGLARGDSSSGYTKSLACNRGKSGSGG